MGSLDEFRRLNDLVKADKATDVERARWAELKQQLIQTTNSDTPSSGVAPMRPGSQRL